MNKNARDRDLRSRTRRPRRRLGLALLLLPATVLGCSSFDSSSDSGSGGTGGDDGPPPMLPGHTVTCCFNGTWDVDSMLKTAHGCQVLTECLDPNIWDPEDPLQLANFCHQKCNPGWETGTMTSPQWKDVVGTPGTWFDTCSALVDFPSPHNNRVVEQNACDPAQAPVVPYSEQLEVAPTHEGSFTTGSHGSDVDISILGNTLAADYALDVQFVVQDCDQNGIDGGRCTLVLSAFDMTTTSAMQVGDYWAIDGSLTLNARVAAEVSFTPCGWTGCVGTFELSETLGNPVGVNLFWTQRNTQTSSIDDGALHLSNGSGGLGGLDSLSGVLTLDRAGELGTLRLIGAGSDSFGSDWATVDFDLVGDVTPL